MFPRQTGTTAVSVTYDTIGTTAHDPSSNDSSQSWQTQSLTWNTTFTFIPTTSVLPMTGGSTIFMLLIPAAALIAAAGCLRHRLNAMQGKV